MKEVSEPRRAFTLVELTVVILIISLLGILVLKFSSNINSVAMPNFTNRLVLQMEGRKIADNLLEEIRKSGDVIRPLIGETTPYLIVKDAENQICYYYLTADAENSRKFGRDLFKLMIHVHTYDMGKGKSRKLGDSIESVGFTGVSPNRIQINVRVANDRNSFQFLSQAGLMSMGDSDV